MLVKSLHTKNAASPMLVTLSGSSMLVKDQHSKNALSPILVTLSGNSMLVKELHSANAPSPMLVTVFPSSVFGIFRTLSSPEYLVISAVPSSKIQY